MNEVKKDESISKEELLAFIKASLQQNKNPQASPSTTQQSPQQIKVEEKTMPSSITNPQNRPLQPQLTPEQEKLTIVKTIMKLHTNIMILCLLIFSIPFITLFTALIDVKIAIIIPMIAIIYPAWIYAHSKRMQNYLSNKYHVKSGFMPFKIKIKTNRKDDVF